MPEINVKIKKTKFSFLNFVLSFCGLNIDDKELADAFNLYVYHNTRFDHIEWNNRKIFFHDVLRSIMR